MRVKGKSIPANIILISLNTEKAYQFKSFEYLPEIEKIYIGAASKNNDGFQTKSSPTQFYFSKMEEAEKLINTLKTKNSRNYREFFV